MGKKSREQTIRIIEDIKKYRNSEDKVYSEAEIMQLLSIPLRSYKRYIKEIHDQDKEAWLNVTRTQLEPELIKLKTSLEHTYKVMKEDLENKAQTTQDKAIACSAKDDARLSIVQLITEGPDYVKKVDDFIQDNNPKKKMDIKRETPK